MNVVIFSTDNIRMFKESPGARRKYFNVQISQMNRKYLKLLNDYNVILRQRNEFLKIINLNKKSDTDYLDILNNKYVDISLEIYNYRNEYVNSINNYLDDMFSSITEIKGLRLKYISNIDNDRKVLLDKLSKNLNKDIMYKMTMIGPNRDDFCFYLDDKNLSLYGSQGQIRSAVLALKMSEVLLFTDKVGESPILLLDDMFSELDINKRNNILRHLINDVQTVITTTDIENISEDIRKKANVYKIENGKIISREIICEQEGDINE
jgi:DNA replication and repair protein RecF